MSNHVYAVTVSSPPLRSEEQYTLSLAAQPTFDHARFRRHAVRCHRKLEAALEEQHEKLAKTLSELYRYKKQHETFSSLYQRYN